jgi:hypothetical protein
MLYLIASSIMSRTTLDIDPGVLRELRRLSTRDGKSMGQVASELLARAVGAEPEAPSPPFVWISRPLGLPRVDLEDREAIRQILDADADD